jgi:hypothetical protein
MGSAPIDPSVMPDSKLEGVVDGLFAARAHIIWVCVLQAHSFLQVGGAE